METARQKILRRLALADLPLAVHEIKADVVSDTSCSARLRELAREGLVVKYPVKSKKYDAWALAPESDYQWTLKI